MSAGTAQSWFVDMIVATGLLMAIVLLVRKPVARYFGPRAAYALWLLPAIRAVLPPVPDAIVFAQSQPLQNLSSTIHFSMAAHLPLAALLVWVLGASAFFIWHSAAYARFSAQLRSSASPMFDDGKISVARSAEVQAPLAFGVIDKAVMLPHDFALRYDGREQHFAIDHELTHHRRGDLRANGFALILLSLHWFNPVAHAAFRAFRADQEAACDATVLAAVLGGASDDDRHAYGRALVKSALGHAPLVACRMSGAGGVKARLTHIIAARDTAHMHEGGLLLASILIFTGLIMTASGGAERVPRIASPQANSPQAILQPRIAANSTEQSIKFAALPRSEPVRARVTISGRSVAGQTSTAKITKVAQIDLPPHTLPRAKIEPATGASSVTGHAVQPAPSTVLAQHSQNKCEANRAVLISEAVFVRGGNAQHISLVLCHMPAPSDVNHAAEIGQRAAIISSLNDARRTVAADERLPIEARVHMINMLEMEIRRIEEVAA